MKCRSLSLLAAIALQILICAGARAQVTIGVLDFVGKGGISQEAADVLADLLAEKVSRMGDVRVITMSDIMSMLALEQQQRLADCDDIKCIVEEIGGALGMSWMVSGNLSRFGDTFVINLKLFDVRAVEVPSRVVREISGGEEDLVEELLDATDELFVKVADRLALAPTVTAASKRVQSIFWSPSTISVYTRQEIRASGAVNIPDFLRRVPGFDIYEMKPSYPLLGARALTEESNNLVLVLIDGREALIEAAGYTVMNSLSITIDEVERIEVIRGPGSALYGSNAFAAVVSITTLSDKPARGAEATLYGGEEGRYGAWARLRNAYQLGEGELSFSAAYAISRARSPSDLREEILQMYSHAHGYLRYRRGADLDLSLHTGLAYGSGTFYTIVGDMPLRHATNPWVMGKALLALSESIELQAQLYYTHFSSDMTTRNSYRAYDIWLADLPDYYVVTSTVDGQLQANFLITDNFNVIAGANLRYTHFEADNYTPAVLEELRGAGFLQASWSPWEPIQFTGGLRLDLSTEIDPALSPRAAIVMRPTEGHAFRLSYGLAFRKPTLFESQAHTRVFNYNQAFPEIVDLMAEQFGNEKLTNEEVHAIELGWQGIFLEDKLRLSADLFFNVYQDYITFVIDLPLRLGLPDLSQATLQYQNVDTAIYAFGGESEAVWRLRAHWSLFANLSVREVIEDGKDRPSEPLLKVNMGGRYTPEEGLRADLALHFTSDHEMPLRDPAATLNAPELMSMGTQLMLIGRVGYRISHDKDRFVEGGLTVRTPLVPPYREWPGAPLPWFQKAEYRSDFAGEVIVRVVSFYLRGSF